MYIETYLCLLDKYLSQEKEVIEVSGQDKDSIRHALLSSFDLLVNLGPFGMSVTFNHVNLHSKNISE